MFNLDSIVEGQLNILESRNQIVWLGSKFETVKKAPRTVAGDFGEGVITEALTKLGINSKIVNKGKGDFDILVTVDGKEIKIENKLATLDVNNCFQFNGIKKNADYDFVFCLGVCPNELMLQVITHKDCQNLKVPMVKDGSDSYKYTVSKKNMTTLTTESFMQIVKGVFFV